MYFIYIFEVGYFYGINYTKIRQCIEKVKDISQVGFDRDYVIKDNKPDVSKVVCQNGQVKVDEIKASGENIWLSGSIEFEVLYTREEVFEGDEPQENITGNRVEHIKDAIPFQEKLVLQESARRIRCVCIPGLMS